MFPLYNDWLTVAVWPPFVVSAAARWVTDTDVVVNEVHFGRLALPPHAPINLNGYLTRD